MEAKTAPVPCRHCGAPALPVDARVFDPVCAAHREAALALLRARLAMVGNEATADGDGGEEEAA